MDRQERETGWKLETSRQTGEGNRLEARDKQTDWRGKQTGS